MSAFENKVDLELLRQIADLEKVPQGAYNIRKDGQLDSRSSTANIEISTKEDKPGIDLWSFAKLTDTFRMIHARRESTLLIISHQERIINLADEIIMVADGQITKHGPKDEIFPEILANTSSGCSYMSEGVSK